MFSCYARLCLYMIDAKILTRFLSINELFKYRYGIKKQFQHNGQSLVSVLYREEKFVEECRNIILLDDYDNIKNKFG